MVFYVGQFQVCYYVVEYVYGWEGVGFLKYYIYVVVYGDGVYVWVVDVLFVEQDVVGYVGVGGQVVYVVDGLQEGCFVVV